MILPEEDPLATQGQKSNEIVRVGRYFTTMYQDGEHAQHAEKRVHADVLDVPVEHYPTLAQEVRGRDRLADHPTRCHDDDNNALHGPAHAAPSATGVLSARVERDALLFTDHVASRYLYRPVYTKHQKERTRYSVTLE
jgi:hypothetical protein